MAGIRNVIDYEQALVLFTVLLDNEPENLAAIIGLRNAIAAYEGEQDYGLPKVQTTAIQLK